MNLPSPPNSPDSPGSASPPSRAQLQASLRSLHAELSRTARVDSGSHRLLQQLLGDMQRLLHEHERDQAQYDETPVEPGSAAGHASEQPGKPPSEPPSERPSERLEELAVQFEADHPRLAGSLRQFVELCSRAGL